MTNVHLKAIAIESALVELTEGFKITLPTFKRLMEVSEKYQVATHSLVRLGEWAILETYQDEPVLVRKSDELHLHESRRKAGYRFPKFLSRNKRYCKPTKFSEFRTIKL